MTTTTPNLKLHKYESTDKPDLRDQYNASMDLLDAAYGKTDADFTKIDNQIAALNTEVNGLNTEVNGLTPEVNGLTTEVNGLTTEVNGLKTTSDTLEKNVAVLQGTSEGHTTSITDINGELAGLGIESADDAVNLKKNIDDAHTQAMTNRADIAAIRADGPTPITQLSFAALAGQSVNLYYSLTANRAWLRLLGSVTLKPGSQITRVPIPGLNGEYGVACDTPLPFTVPGTPRIFTAVGWSGLYDTTTHGIIPRPTTAVIGTDNKIYLLRGSSNKYALNANNSEYLIFLQIPLSLNSEPYPDIDVVE